MTPSEQQIHWQYDGILFNIFKVDYDTILYKTYVVNDLWISLQLNWVGWNTII